MNAGCGAMKSTGMVCEREAVVKLYERMAADGVLDEQIDGSAGASADGKVDCEEVLEAGLSLGDRYGDYFQRLTGRPVPWLLDDADPGTSFDKGVRRRIDRAIAVARRDLKAMGLAPGDAEYDRRLGIALYCFAFLQGKDELRFTMRENPSAALQFTHIVEGMGLVRLVKHMAKEGGLGLRRKAVDTKMEATAIEALELQKGICTERSKILYAIFNRAGLDAGFAHMTLRELHSTWMRLYGSSKKPPVTVKDYFEGHVVATIIAGGETVYFEPNLFVYDVDYGDVARRIGLREMFQGDLSNLSSTLYDEGEIEAAERFVDGGLLLGDTLLGQHLLYHRALHYSRDRRDKERVGVALGLLSRIIARDPSFEAARMYICEIKASMGKVGEAQECFLRLPEDAAQKHLGLAQLAIDRKDWPAVRSHLEASMELGIDPALVLPVMADAAEKAGDAKGALELYERATAFAPRDPSVRRRAYALSSQAGDHAGAIAHLKPLLLDNPMDKQQVLNCAIELVAQARTEEAAQYFTRYAFLYIMSDQQGMGAYDELVKMADELGMWEAADVAVLPFVENKLLVVGVELIHIHALACRAGSKGEAGEAFSSFTDRLAAMPGKSMLPSEVYWRIADVAERIGTWRDLHGLCISFGAYSPFEVFAMHAAWRAGDDSLLDEDIARFKSSMKEIRSFAPEDRRPSVLRAICAAIERLPAGLVKEELYGALLGEPFFLLGATLEANGDKGGALWAYLNSARMGLHDDEVAAAIERLEKSFEM